MGLTTLVGKINNIVQGEKYTITIPSTKLSKMYVNEKIPINVNVSKDNIPKDNLKVYLRIDGIVYEDTRELTNNNGDATLTLKLSTIGTHTVEVFINESNVSESLTVNILNPDYYVSMSGSDSNDGLTLSTAFLTLNKAVTSASTGNCIFIQSGTYKSTSNCALTISKNLTVYSENAIFDGESTRQSGFIIPTGYNLVLNGLTFSNGANYGALNISSNNIIVYCNFKNNKKSTTYTDSDKPSCCGAGIFVSSEKNFIYNCSFSGNTASSGGAICFDSSSNYNTVRDCSFSGNTASSGGAICFDSSSNYNTVRDCSFSGNTASYGGAICFDSSSNNTVSDCSFSGNTASSDGGAICFDSSSNNTVRDCSFSGNTASSSGGAIRFMSSSNYNTVRDCSFIKNKVGTSIQNIYVNNTNCTGNFNNCYWGTNTPSTTDYGTIQNITVTNNATTLTVYNLFKYTPTSVNTGAKVNLTLICRDVYGEPLQNMNLTLKNGTSTLTTLTTDNNGIATYTVTVNSAMSLTITNTVTNNYNSCTSETRTITVA